MFTLEIKTGNAAFQSEYDFDTKTTMRFELARILRDTADKLEDGISDYGNVLDINGNHCGKWEIK